MYCSLLVLDPGKRLTASEALQQPWLQNLALAELAEDVIIDTSSMRTLLRKRRWKTLKTHLVLTPSNVKIFN